MEEAYWAFNYLCEYYQMIQRESLLDKRQAWVCFFQCPPSPRIGQVSEEEEIVS